VTPRLYLYLGIAVGVAMLLFITYSKGVEHGRLSEAAKINASIRKEDASNRVLEQSIQNTLNDWGKKFQITREQQSVRENVVRERIIHALPTLPDCRIPDTMLEDRNQIRNDTALPE
jgi:hypothetical protein